MNRAWTYLIIAALLLAPCMVANPSPALAKAYSTMASGEMHHQSPAMHGASQSDPAQQACEMDCLTWAKAERPEQPLALIVAFSFDYPDSNAAALAFSLAVNDFQSTGPPPIARHALPPKDLIKTRTSRLRL